MKATRLKRIELTVSDLPRLERFYVSSLGFERMSEDELPLSRDGPQHLPQRSGGATAFKFRDPDGHPL